jgi:sialate O-acetylesterase
MRRVMRDDIKNILKMFDFFSKQIMAKSKRMNFTGKLVCAFLFSSGFLMHTAFSQVRLPRLVRDSMILQRDTKIKIWGWASAEEKINIKFNNKNFKTTTEANGKWMIILPAMKAGGPYEMKIDSRNHISLNNILIGDVWICAGQSNMVHQMILHKEKYSQEIAKDNYPEIRHFFIPTLTDLQYPRDDLPTGYWKSAIAGDILQFSAVAYFFAKTIYHKYHVPIGLINASVGGTPIEAWTSEEGLKEFPALKNTITKNKDSAYTNSITRTALARNANRPKQQDKGLTGVKTWYDTTYVPQGWHNIYLPGYWEDQGIKDLDGVVWYRRQINVPESMTGVPAKISMGRIVDADFIYINGTAVGSTSYQYPQRRYSLPAGSLKTGKNIFVIRVINNSGKGGFVPDKPYYLTAGRDTIELMGIWQYKVGDVFIPDRNPSGSFSFQNQPAALFNAMISPLTNYPIKGIIWYQGESNTNNASEYTKILPVLINDWRSHWKQGNVPFIYVQLPNFMDVQYLPSESQWALVREAQLKSLSVPNTGMAVAIDLGEWNDIHPDNKKDVGIRLALAALKVAYGEKDIVYSGPILQSSKIEGNKIILTFSNTGSGLVSNDGEELSQFAIAGADLKFVWAKAIIQGNNVVEVWNDELTNPLYVRYAWADNPEGANLYNKEGLPASPFRTDQHPNRKIK